MVKIIDYREKRKWENELESAKRRSDRNVGNSDPRAQADLASAYDQEATAYVNLGRLDPSKQKWYDKTAAETWDAAAEAADHSVTQKGDVARMYRSYAKDARKRAGVSEKKGGLEKAAVAIIGLLGGVFFLSSNLTGNVIGASQTSLNWIGGVLFIMGLVGAFAYFRKKN